jgi:hypothetical protein
LDASDTLRAKMGRVLAGIDPIRHGETVIGNRIDLSRGVYAIRLAIKTALRDRHGTQGPPLFEQAAPLPKGVDRINLVAVEWAFFAIRPFLSSMYRLSTEPCTAGADDAADAIPKHLNRGTDATTRV